MKMKNKSIMVIVLVTIVLAAAVTVFAILHSNNLDEKQGNIALSTVEIVQGDRTAQLSLDELKDYGEVEFVAMLDTSKTDGEEQPFTGVSLVTALEEMGYSLEKAEQVVFTAVDGYTTAVSADEAKDAHNVYIVYERNGKPSGTMEEGGTGPIEIVIAKDEYSQRWCKYLVQIELQ